MLTILVDGLTYASWLFIVALGLTLVFGVLKILNIAHGRLIVMQAAQQISRGVGQQGMNAFHPITEFLKRQARAMNGCGIIRSDGNLVLNDAGVSIIHDGPDGGLCFGGIFAEQSSL